jgi:serine/threonine protein kinase
LYRDRKAIEKFENELQVLKGLSHHHIVQFVCSFTDPIYVCRLVSKVADRNLDSFLNNMPFLKSDLPILRGFYGCLVSAVLYLHRNLCHLRTLSPRGILVKENEIFITDLGTDGESSNHEEKGPIAEILTGYLRRYAAPEVLFHESRSSAADMYSLGCIFLEMTTVLNQHTLENKSRFFLNLGTHHEGPAFNLYALHEWFDQLSSDGGELEPLTWTRQMLLRKPEDRLSAKDLQKRILSSPGPHAYYGSCCSDQWTATGSLSDEDSEISSYIGSESSTFASSTSSKTSIEHRVKSLARDEFITLLLDDESLEGIYRTAILSPRIGPDKFEKRLRHFLNLYSIDLKKEAISRVQNSAVYLVRSQSRYMANTIRRAMAQINDGSMKLELLQQRHKATGRDLDLVERFLQDADRNTRPEDERTLESSQQRPSEGPELQPKSGEKDSDSEDSNSDDGMIEPQEDEALNTLSAIKEFMVSSNAFFVLRENLWHFAHRTLRTRMSRIFNKVSESDHENPLPEASRARLNSLIKELDRIPPDQIWISDQDINSFSNSFKGIIEDRTGETWDWWPLRPRIRALPAGQARLHWRCVSSPIQSAETLAETF